MKILKNSQIFQEREIERQREREKIEKISIVILLTNNNHTTNNNNQTLKFMENILYCERNISL